MAALGSVGQLVDDDMLSVGGWRTVVTPTGTGTISGTVQDSTGAFVARTIRAYERTTGLFIAETVSDGSGNYSLTNMPAVEHTLLCLDDAAGTVYNDLVLRTTPV